MYLQRRITAETHSAAVTALETVTGRALLVNTINDYGPKHALTRLSVPLDAGVAG